MIQLQQRFVLILGLKNDETCVATYESCYSYMPYDSGATVNAIEANREAIHDASVAWKLPAKAGREVPGELYTPTQRNIGDGTVQVSIDNEFLKEQRELNNIVFSKSYIEDSAYRFNLMEQHIKIWNLDLLVVLHGVAGCRKII
mgnify:CR=1 FL=1